ncbi:MAG TPA: hypothetical protein VFF82_02930 [Rhodocyclaceae bacterium]|nr:hypothetical protein [Rhodocyclaceae bacterium]
MNASQWRQVGWIGVFGISAAIVAMTTYADSPQTGGELSVLTVRQAKKPTRQVKADPAQSGHIELERLQRAAAKGESKEMPAHIAADAAADAVKTPLDTTRSENDVTNAFATTSWYVPPPPPKPEPPPKPTAPPLPFAFMGRYDDGIHAGAVVMLTKGDRLYTVGEGDVIEETYRVDRITERVVELMYLPLNTKQVLPVGGT